MQILQPSDLLKQNLWGWGPAAHHLIFGARFHSCWVFTSFVLNFHFPPVVTSFSLCCLPSMRHYPSRGLYPDTDPSGPLSHSLHWWKMLSKIPLGSHVLQLCGSHAVQDHTGLVSGLVFLPFKNLLAVSYQTNRDSSRAQSAKTLNCSLQMLLLNHISPSGMTQLISWT